MRSLTPSNKYEKIHTTPSSKRLNCFYISRLYSIPFLKVLSIMYSVTYLSSLGMSVWMMLLFFGAGHSKPISQDQSCDGSGSAPVHCLPKVDTELEEEFRGREDLYLQKVRIGNETAFAGSIVDIFNDCLGELVMDYDSQRFPQYLIQSTCKDRLHCKISSNYNIKVLKLNRSHCDDDGHEIYEQQPPVFLSLCIDTSQGTR